MYVTDGMTVASLFANFLQKMSAAMVDLCQIVLNQALSCKFKKWWKFSSCVKVKSHKKKHINPDLPV